MLAFGLVAFTVWGVAKGAPWLFAGFDWKAGLVLGALVAPTDAIAASSLGQRIGLPKRIMDVLEGESLVNDASGLLALEFGLAILVRRETPTVAAASMRLVFLIVAGLAIGLATAWLVEWIERRVDDGPIEIAISILVPYAAYFTADRVHASGVLAVVACGLHLSRKSSGFFSPGVRLQAWAVWDSLTFILNGLVFVLIGLQLPNVLAGIHNYNLLTLVLYGALFSALLIALGCCGSFLARDGLLDSHPSASPKSKMPNAERAAGPGMAGMRGVIALAAAMALPQTLADGGTFPQRNLIIFLAFSAILVTLVLQGTTLPWVVRWLGVAEANGPNLEEEAARRQMLEAALGT